MIDLEEYIYLEIFLYGLYLFLFEMETPDEGTSKVLGVLLKCKILVSFAELFLRS